VLNPSLFLCHLVLVFSLATCFLHSLAFWTVLPVNTFCLKKSSLQYCMIIASVDWAQKVIAAMNVQTNQLCLCQLRIAFYERGKIC
jgi:hypothetical protein